jgi:hypothetical protein
MVLLIKSINKRSTQSGAERLFCDHHFDGANTQVKTWRYAAY